MERIVITILPPHPAEGLLSVTDAMQQVLDTIALFTGAQQAMVNPTKAFEWRLESASTNSPLTITALAVPIRPNDDIISDARHIKDVVSSGLVNLMEKGEPAWWMQPDMLEKARSIFERNLNGIARTEISLSKERVVSIDRDHAAAGVRAIQGFDALSVGKDLSARTAWGEIEGAIVAAGRYQKNPAIQIFTELYGYVWCTLSPELIQEFGDAHTLNEVWRGRSLGIKGRLIYGDGGKLSRIEAKAIREIPRSSPVDLEAIMDPDFTSGLHPVEYLRRLNDGELA